MRTVRCAGAAGIVLTVWLIAAPTGVVAAAPEHQATLELRVITYSSLDSADLFLASETAIALLATAGLHVTWRECGGASCAVPCDAPFLLVRLLPIASRTAPEISGEVVREPATNHPSVLVFVPRNVEVTQKIRQSPAGRSNPGLATLASGHLVGLTIAHEVGHSLGLKHSASGPMKAQPVLDDLIAMRRSILRFPSNLTVSSNGEESLCDRSFSVCVCSRPPEAAKP